MGWDYGEEMVGKDTANTALNKDISEMYRMNKKHTADFLEMCTGLEERETAAKGKVKGAEADIEKESGVQRWGVGESGEKIGRLLE